jgi:DNA-binding HxlR family transcriptional regulator
METMPTSTPAPIIRIHDVYDKNCPTRHALDRIADKYTVLVVVFLHNKPRRFNELQRVITGISQKVLTQTLRSLERDGLISRTVYPEVPPHVEYALTPLGETLIQPLATLRHWAETHIEAVMDAQSTYDQKHP